MHECTVGTVARRSALLALLRAAYSLSTFPSATHSLFEWLDSLSIDFLTLTFCLTTTTERHSLLSAFSYSVSLAFSPNSLADKRALMCTKHGHLVTVWLLAGRNIEHILADWGQPLFRGWQASSDRLLPLISPGCLQLSGTGIVTAWVVHGRG